MQNLGLRPIPFRLAAFCSLLSLAALGRPATAQQTGAPVTVRGGACVVAFSADHGAIVAVRDASAPVAGDGRVTRAADLWELHLRNGMVLRARDFPCHCARIGANELRFQYDVPGGGSVVVRAVGSASGVDLSARIAGMPEDVLEVGLPPDLTFDPDRLDRVLFPSYLGVALKPAFFRVHRAATGWLGDGAASEGPDGLRRVAGVTCTIGPDGAPAAVRATDIGRQMLGADLADRWAAHPSLVNRPPVGTPDLDVLTSAAGSYLAGHRVGGGWLFRFGGLVQASDGDLVTETTEWLLAALASRTAAARGAALNGGARPRVVLLALDHGPDSGSWSDIGVADWKAHLAASQPLRDAGLDVAVARTYSEFAAALQGAGTFAVVNPYGEWFPVPGRDPNDTLDAIHAYLEQGGIWMATGGYPFYHALRPVYSDSLDEHYPSRGFSDFSRIETSSGTVNYSGIQNAHDATHIFVPVRWRAEGSGDAPGSAGGHVLRFWQTFVGHGASWETPVVRLSAGGGGGAAASIRTYARDNGLDRPLASKMPARLHDIWVRSVAIKCNMPNCAQDMTMIERIPTPAIIHIADYLHGHFDKQLPDILPPSPDYGTAEQFEQLISLVHAKGDLFMPYTNTTWWCDDPKGPTFLHEGDAPLLRDLDGKTVHEQYGPNGGWSISPFHPAVIAASDRVTNAFTTDYPADILFQDQNGARGLEYDTNPASPTVYAYTQGMIDLAQRAGRRLPVATEDGFDRLLNIESEFCGLSQSLGAIPVHVDMRLSQHLSDDDWEFFPIAQYVGHDKAFFMHHDLEQGASDRPTLAWTLALGYQLSAEVHAGSQEDPEKLRWLSMLSQLQKALGQHYMGVALTSFRYLQGSGEHGVMETVYGDLRIVSNLTYQPYVDGPVTIAPDGFYARVGALETGFLTAYHGQPADSQTLLFSP